MDQREFSLAEDILEKNKIGRYYCEYLPDSMEELILESKKSNIQLIKEDDLIFVLDKFEESNRHIAEVWGPYPHRSYNLNNFKNYIKKYMPFKESSLRFFFDAENSELSDWLSKQKAVFTNQTIWKMVQVKPEKDLKTQWYDKKISNRDLRAVSNLHHKFFSINLYIDQQHPLLLVYKNGKMAAYASIEIEKKLARILYLGVDPDFRRQGIATELLAEIWLFFSKLKISDIFLVQSAKAEAAGKLYKIPDSKYTESFYQQHST